MLDFLVITLKESF